MRASKSACLLAVLLCIFLSAEQTSAWSKAAPPPAAPPPPPPPPPSAVAQAKAALSSAAATAAAKVGAVMPSRAQLKHAFVAAANVGAAQAAALYAVLRQHVPMALAQLKASTDASKYGTPSAAVVARVLTLAAAPLVRESALVACFLAVCFALRKRSGTSGRKLLAQSALVCAVLNWMTFTLAVNTLASAVVAALTLLDALVQNPSVLLCAALAANAGDVRRRVGALKPAPRPEAAPSALAEAPAAAAEVPAATAAGCLPSEAEQAAPAASAATAPRATPPARVAVSATVEAGAKAKVTTLGAAPPKSSPTGARPAK